MSSFPSREMVERIKALYPKGVRVSLVQMNDPHTNLKPGDEGTVMFVDDMATVHIQWDNGSTLGAAYGEDSIQKTE
jgi:hypothetical protein